MIAQQKLVIGAERLFGDGLLQCADLRFEQVFLCIEAAGVEDCRFVGGDLGHGLAQDAGGHGIIADGKEGLCIGEGEDRVVGVEPDGLPELFGSVVVAASLKEFDGVGKAQVCGGFVFGGVEGLLTGVEALADIAEIVRGGIEVIIAAGIVGCRSAVGGGCVCVVGVIGIVRIVAGGGRYDVGSVPVIGMRAVPVVAYMAIAWPVSAEADKDILAVIARVIVGYAVPVVVGDDGDASATEAGPVEDEAAAIGIPVGAGLEVGDACDASRGDVGSRLCGGYIALNDDVVVAVDDDLAGGIARGAGVVCPRAVGLRDGVGGAEGVGTSIDRAICLGLQGGGSGTCVGVCGCSVVQTADGVVAARAGAIGGVACGCLAGGLNGGGVGVVGGAAGGDAFGLCLDVIDGDADGFDGALPEGGGGFAAFGGGVGCAGVSLIPGGPVIVEVVASGRGGLGRRAGDAVGVGCAVCGLCADGPGDGLSVDAILCGPGLGADGGVCRDDPVCVCGGRGCYGATYCGCRFTGLDCRWRPGRLWCYGRLRDGRGLSGYAGDRAFNGPGCGCACWDFLPRGRGPPYGGLSLDRTGLGDRGWCGRPCRGGGPCGLRRGGRCGLRSGRGLTRRCRRRRRGRTTCRLGSGAFGLGRGSASCGGAVGSGVGQRYRRQ